ncbi:MAG: endopeptidase La [Bacteroidetes bacterium CG2_30_33_31]|nr:MAG: endopeptidase La [Bacteroidetes bacterium CG2_30_33_31]
MKYKNFRQLDLTDIAGGDTDFFPLMSGPEDFNFDNADVPVTLPVLPLRNTVLFPGVLIPITVGRPKSLKLINDAYAGNKLIAVVAQKDANTEDPQYDSLYKIGVMATILKVLKMPDETTTVIIQGRNRIEILEETQTEPYFVAKIEPLLTDIIVKNDKSFEALMDSIKDLALKIINLNPNIPNEAGFAIKNIESPSFLVNFVSSNLNSSLKEKQALIEIVDLSERGDKLLKLLSKEVQMLELKNQIQDKVKVDLDKQQRDYLLNQQLKTIQDELGGTPHEQDILTLKEKAGKKIWQKNVQELFVKELDKLSRMHPSAAEYSIQHNYLETLVDLPWSEFSNDEFELKKAEQILNEDHYGLESVKERIIEYLAVLKLKGDVKSPILCLVGPPGVGKTSLGKSIARSLGREYVRMALGGLRDEAEIRGHRKTYIGAMPGRIIQSLKKAKKSNPVFVLDEVDKIASNSYNGDPASALLEVLDPEQNSSFYDNYLEVEYDLSRILFIATANSLSTIHPALRDRMEIIDINGYLIDEKIQIAKRHLIKKQFAEHGLKANQLKFSNQVLEKIIEDYTMESGVRNLDKQIAKVIRNRAKYIVMGEDYNPKLSIEDLRSIMGPSKFSQDYANENNQPGVITGLAWTQVGGKILFIEVSVSRGKGELSMTGSLGDVMKESFTIAHKLVKAKADELKIPQIAFQNWDVHIHVPEGATPKDGPSAGITIFTALVSAYTQRKVKPRLAMTGELTLRSKVTAVGGIKEKILAAKRANINEIVLSRENEKDILEINEKYIKGLKFHYIDKAMEAIEIALMKTKIQNPIQFI